MYQLFNVSRVDAYRSLWRCTFPVLQSLAKLCVYLDSDQLPELSEREFQLW